MILNWKTGRSLFARRHFLERSEQKRSQGSVKSGLAASNHMLRREAIRLCLFGIREEMAR